MKRTIFDIFLIATVATGLFSLNSFVNMPDESRYKYQHPAEMNYQNFCAGCHGHNLEKFAAKAWMDETGNTSAIQSITYGIEDIGMPAFRKTFTNAEKVRDFIATMTDLYFNEEVKDFILPNRYI